MMATGIILCLLGAMYLSALSMSLRQLSKSALHKRLVDADSLLRRVSDTGVQRTARQVRSGDDHEAN